MSINLMAFGSGHYETHYFTVSRNVEGENVRVGTMYLQRNEIPELIEQLSEWVEEAS